MVEDREQKLLDAEREAETALSDRRAVLGDIERIAAFAEDLGGFLKDSELTERRAFISSFVEEIVVDPGQARYATLCPCRRTPRQPGWAPSTCPSRDRFFQQWILVGRT